MKKNKNDDEIFEKILLKNNFNFEEKTIDEYIKCVLENIIAENFVVDENIVIFVLENMFYVFIKKNVVKFLSFIFNFKFEFSYDGIFKIITILKYKYIKSNYFYSFILDFLSKSDFFDYSIINLIFSPVGEYSGIDTKELYLSFVKKHGSIYELQNDGYYLMCRICFENKIIRNKIVIDDNFVNAFCDNYIELTDDTMMFIENNILKANFPEDKNQYILYILFFCHSNKILTFIKKNKNNVVVDIKCLNYYLKKKKNGKIPDKIKELFVKNCVKPTVETYENAVIAKNNNFDFIVSL